MGRRQRLVRVFALVGAVGILIVVAVLTITSFLAAAQPAPTVAKLATPLPTAAVPTAQPTPVALPSGNDWTQYRYDTSGSGVNPEGRITTGTVWHVTQAWQNGHYPSFESTPAILDGTVYVTNNNSLVAFDLQTGVKLWQFDDKPQNSATISSSVSLDPALGLAFYGTPDARVYAVNIATHQEAWDVQLGDPKKGAFIWSSPLLANGNVYIGLASKQDNPCVRGGVFALNEHTGHSIWTHYMVPAGVLGGSVWSSMIAVPAHHEVIATTGNPCPEGNTVAQDDAIVAMDWDSGNTLWQYIALPYDNCDCDFGQGPVDFTYHGQEYVVAGSKAGYVYAVIPPQSGQFAALAWSAIVAPPGYLGEGGIFEPPTYANGIVYIAGGPSADGLCSGGSLTAFQADSGAVLWHTCTSGQVVSPAAISGGVLFVAQTGVIVGYDAVSGHTLWQAKYTGSVWGGVAVSRGFIVFGAVNGILYGFTLPRAHVGR
jgi:outer membrane protein assembly factor BamB